MVFLIRVGSFLAGVSLVAIAESAEPWRNPDASSGKSAKKVLYPPPPPPPPPPIPSAAAPPRPAAVPAVLKGGSISNDDYPSSAKRNEEQGTSVAIFTIGVDGHVTSCSASGASPTLDAETCRLIMKRFRFTPATIGGRPVESLKMQRVTWRLERDEPPKPDFALPIQFVKPNQGIKIDLALEVNWRGEIATCDLAPSAEDRSYFMVDICEAYAKDRKMPIRRNAARRPINYLLTQSVWLAKP